MIIALVACDIHTTTHPLWLTTLVGVLFLRRHSPLILLPGRAGSVESVVRFMASESVSVLLPATRPSDVWPRTHQPQLLFSSKCSDGSVQSSPHATLVKLATGWKRLHACNLSKRTRRYTKTQYAGKTATTSTVWVASDSMDEPTRTKPEWMNRLHVWIGSSAEIRVWGKQSTRASIKLKKLGVEVQALNWRQNRRCQICNQITTFIFIIIRQTCCVI